MARILSLRRGFLTETVRVALVQISCELVIDTSSGLIDLREPKTQMSKVQDALEQIGNWGVNLVVLPEYSISCEMVPMLQGVADKFRYIVIAGSFHDEATRQNVCPICIPNAETEYCGKKALTAFEATVVTPSKEAGAHIHWEFGKRSYCIQIYLCVDYLGSMYPLALLDSKRTGVVVVPACTSALRDFYNLAGIHLRHEKGKFILIANSVATLTSRTQSGFSMPHVISSGKSAIWGSSEGIANGVPYMSFDEDSEVEGILACTLNLGNPQYTIINPTPVVYQYQSAPIFRPTKLYLSPTH